MNAYQKETDISEDEFIDILDEMHGGPLHLFGMEYSAGRALLELDPTAFRCALSDYESGHDSENPVWVCDKCDEEFDNEEDAQACCKEEESK